jgi:hypothetical protein
MTAKQLGHDEFVTFSSGAYNAGFTLTLYVDGGIRSSAALVCQVKLGVRTLTFALHQDGYPIECSPQGRSWSPVGESKFDAMSHYRVLLKPGMPEAPAVESDPDGF